MVQGVEVWVPDGEVLVWSSGAYAEHTELEHSRRMLFRRGEGLPGAVWSTERALTWKDPAVHFVREELVNAAGIDTAIGVPIWRGRELRAVVVLLLTHRCNSPGCVELWDTDTELAVLEHGGGHYSGCPDFETFSALIQFPIGTGLPGRTWAAGLPLIMPDVRRANTFIRSGLAKRCGLQRGVGLPLRRGRAVVQVVTLIAAEEHPFMRAVELWEPDLSGLRLELLGASDELQQIQKPGPEPARGAALAADVLATGLPRVVNGSELARSPLEGGDAAPQIGLGIPIFDNERLRKILCLMF